MYTVQCNNVAVSAVQDIIAAFSGASRVIKVHGVQLGANGQTTVGNYRIRLVHYAATVTAGSGGSTPTPQKTNPNDAAASFTAHTNDTTPATSSTATNTIFSDEFNPINGFYWQPPFRDAAPEATISEAMVLSLDSISGSLNVNATMWVEEV
jgi:5-deoxy-D-glucuronate isomerase